MSQLQPGDNASSDTNDEEEMDAVDYDDMELLERLESLREDMEDLGVTTLAEVIKRIEEMHQRLDRK